MGLGFARTGDPPKLAIRSPLGLTGASGMGFGILCLGSLRYRGSLRTGDALGLGALRNGGPSGMRDFCDWRLLESGFPQEWGSLEIGGLFWDWGPSGLEIPWDWGPSGLAPLGAGGPWGLGSHLQEGRGREGAEGGGDAGARLLLNHLPQRVVLGGTARSPQNPPHGHPHHPPEPLTHPREPLPTLGTRQRGQTRLFWEWAAPRPLPATKVPPTPAWGSGGLGWGCHQVPHPGKDPSSPSGRRWSS